MLLVKNKLKRLKKTIDDDDMLNYLKYSHIDILNDNNENNNNNKNKNIEDKATQFPEMMNKSTQTKGRETSEKGVDTGNDFDEVIPPYVSFIHSEDFDRHEKMVQVWTKMFKENLTPSPPNSSSSSSSGSEGFPSKMARGGFRLAEFALNTAITTANLTMALSDALVDLTSAPHQSSEEEQQQQEVISVHSSPPQTINSSSSGVIEISSSGSSRQTQTTIPQPTSPQSSPASSAKTTPRKKSK